MNSLYAEELKKLEQMDAETYDLFVEDSQAILMSHIINAIEAHELDWSLESGDQYLAEVRNRDQYPKRVERVGSSPALALLAAYLGALDVGLR